MPRVNCQESGLPPRGRGNREVEGAYVVWIGSTPAWAGKPWSEFPTRRADGVYPRVGGETIVTCPIKLPSTGLPPRGRGNLNVKLLGKVRLRSTPAWAGKPCQAMIQKYKVKVYPRVGGETQIGCNAQCLPAGLPPRGRGNQPPNHPLDHRKGSTPAWAGKPVRAQLWTFILEVYPRVGGETARWALRQQTPPGLPPRGRGNLWAAMSSGFPVRSTPAWAGKPSESEGMRPRQPVYPRVGGETHFCPGCRWLVAGLPPRGRGNRFKGNSHQYRARSTPAWAGKPLPSW